MKNKTKRTYSYFCADFECTNVSKKEDIPKLCGGEGKTAVWAAGVAPISSKITPDDVIIVNSMDKFFGVVKNLASTDCETIIIFYHNLAYDGTYLLNKLFEEGYEHSSDFTPKERCYTSLINSGIYYSIKVNFGNKLIVDFRDSQKLINAKVEKIAKDFDTGLEKLTGTIDYNLDRKPGEKLTNTEDLYLRHDVAVMAIALGKCIDSGLNIVDKDIYTIAGAAMKSFKSMYSTDELKKYFPPLSSDVDKFIRRCYKGGICQLNPYKTDKDGCITVKNCEEGIYCYDVTSLYPYNSHSKSGNKFPIGFPMAFNGIEGLMKIVNKDYYYYFIHIKCNININNNHLPFLQLKASSRFAENEYIQSTNGEPIDLYLTKTDFELMNEQYYGDIEICEGYYFMTREGIFDKYFDYWFNVKDKASKEGNKTMRSIAKLFLNSLIGRFAISEIQVIDTPYINDKGTLSMKHDIDVKPGRALALPAAAAILAYSRAYITHAVQNNIDNFLYMDTDSMYLIGKAKENSCDLGNDLGQFKLESISDNFKAVRQKTYISHHIQEDGKDISPVWVIKAAGCNQETKDRMLYDVKPFEPLKYDESGKCITRKLSNDELLEKFAPGYEQSGKLMHKQVKGGCILLDSTFKIKSK